MHQVLLRARFPHIDFVFYSAFRDRYARTQMIHPHTELKKISPDLGYGVFATTTIPMGTITWVMDEFDLLIPQAKVERLSADYRNVIDTYAFQDPDGNSVLCWDFGRFLNHACEPTCLCLGVICDVAARDILPGEQLTCDYGLLNGEETFTCACGSPKCRGRADRAAFISTAKELDVLVASLVPAVKHTPQPLVQYMLPRDREALQNILSGAVPLPSCLENLPENARPSL